MQRIQVFNLHLQFIKQFGYGEIRLPIDITIYADTLHILSQDQNTIYCYNRDGTNLKKIELTGQEQQMTTAVSFTIDKRGDFIITDNSINEIRILSPDGVSSTLYLTFLGSILLDNTNNIICVCSGYANDFFQKY